MNRVFKKVSPMVFFLWIMSVVLVMVVMDASASASEAPFNCRAVKKGLYCGTKAPRQVVSQKFWLPTL